MSNTFPQSLEVWCAGVSHHTAAVRLREAFAVAQGQMPALYREIKGRFRLQELLILSTCNRFELYVVFKKNEALDLSLESLLDAVAEMVGRQQIPSRELRDHAFVFRAQAAVEHFFLVCSSLDSLVLGETQITGQVKSALKVAKQCGSLGVNLSRLGNHALSCAKSVRTQTDISRETVSISHAAIDLAKKVFGRLGEHKFLLIGAGEMAETALRYALSYEPREIFVTNRTLSSAQSLVDHLGYGSAYPLSELKELLLEADIVISSTGADHFIVSSDLLKEVMLERRRKAKGSLFMVDIAVPRDVEPECAQFEDVYLFEIDDLEEAVKEGTKKRQKAAGQGRLLASQHAMQYMRWFGDASRRDSLKLYKRYVDEIVKIEFSKSTRKSALTDLSEEQIAAIEKMQAAVVRRLVSDMAELIEGISDEDQQEQFSALLREGLDRKPERSSLLEWHPSRNSQST